jgi:hypothetical protein
MEQPPHDVERKLSEYLFRQLVKLDNSVNSLKNAPVGSNPNLVINGNFDIWQRGVSQTTSGYGSADRWVMSNIGTTKVTTQQTFPIGEIPPVDNVKYYCETVVNSVAGTGNNCVMSYRVPNVANLSGKTVTLSFWANVAAAQNMSVEFRQFFGTGGTPSVSVDAGVKKFQIGTTWKKYVITVNIPSVIGKTLGTDGNDLTRVNFWFDAGSDFDSRTDSLGQQSGTFRIAQVKLELGSVETPYQPEDVNEVLRKCQAYYWKGKPGSSVLNFSSYAIGAIGAFPIMFPTTMRATPTVTFDPPTPTNCNAPVIPNITQDGFKIQATSTAIAPSVSFSFGSTQFIYADAEI